MGTTTEILHASGEAPHSYCDQCGAALPPNAGFCAECGAPVAEQARPPSRRRRFAIVGVALALLAAAAAVGAILLTGGDATKPKPVVHNRTTPSAVAPTWLSESAAKDMVNRYVLAFESQSVPALNVLFAPDFKLKRGTAPDQDRDSALASYARQFDELSDPTLTVRDLKVDGQRGFVTGTYEMFDAGRTEVGGISLVVEPTSSGERLSFVAIAPATGSQSQGSAENQNNQNNGSPERNTKQYANTAHVTTYYRNWGGASAYVHFKAVDSSGRTVAEALGSDEVTNAEGSALGETPARRALVEELRKQLVADGWHETGRVQGGDWYEFRFGK